MVRSLLHQLDRTEKNNNNNNHFESNACSLFSILETHLDAPIDSTDLECILRRNTAAGSTSGLQIFFKHFNSSQRLRNASKITGQPAVRVCEKT